MINFKSYFKLLVLLEILAATNSELIFNSNLDIGKTDSPETKNRIINLDIDQINIKNAEGITTEEIQESTIGTTTITTSTTTITTSTTTITTSTTTIAEESTTTTSTSTSTRTIENTSEAYETAPSISTVIQTQGSSTIHFTSTILNATDTIIISPISTTTPIFLQTSTSVIYTTPIIITNTSSISTTQKITTLTKTTTTTTTLEITENERSTKIVKILELKDEMLFLYIFLPVLWVISMVLIIVLVKRRRAINDRWRKKRQNRKNRKLHKSSNAKDNELRPMKGIRTNSSLKNEYIIPVQFEELPYNEI